MVTRDSIESEAFQAYLHQKNEAWRRMPKGLESQFEYHVDQANTHKQLVPPPSIAALHIKHWDDEFLYQALACQNYSTIIELTDQQSFQWEASSQAKAAQRVLIVVAENANCKLHETLTILQSVRSVDIYLQPGARLQHEQIIHPQQTVFDHLHVYVDANASYQQLFCTVGSTDVLYRRAQQIHLLGVNSQASIQGGVLSKAQSYIQDHVSFVHHKAHTHSHHQTKTVVESLGKIDVYSDVSVTNEAPFSVSRQYIHHLLLAETASVFSKPSLDIDIDEVDSQHGAVSGMIDDQLLFYMESRGIDKEQAKQLYLHGYIQTCFSDSTKQQQKLMSQYLEQHIDAL